MKIAEVNYERLQSLPGYNNERVGAKAILEEGETPEQALSELKKWVGEQLGVYEELSAARNELYFTKEKLISCNREIDVKKQQIERMVAFLEKHGVTLNENIPYGSEDDLPF